MKLTNGDAERGVLRLAEQVVTQLASQNAKVVLAESCTAGLISASLASVPGVSRYLCGSAVVYREQTKIDWLGVCPETLHSHTAVSEQTTAELALGVLRNTVEADWSLGITGHLGPGSPDELDGHIFVACARRSKTLPWPVSPARCRLQAQARVERQYEAAAFGLQYLLNCLAHGAPDQRSGK